MDRVIREARVPYQAACLFNLVNDIEDYPNFLPWCKEGRILLREGQVLTASLTIAKGGISKTFTTRNILTPHRQIEMQLVSGPFKHLYGNWEFEESMRQTLVRLSMEFSFDSKMIALLLGPIFNQIANSLLEAFCERAKLVCPKLA